MFSLFTRSDKNTSTKTPVDANIFMSVRMAFRTGEAKLQDIFAADSSAKLNKLFGEQRSSVIKYVKNYATYHDKDFAPLDYKRESDLNEKQGKNITPDSVLFTMRLLSAKYQLCEYSVKLALATAIRDELKKMESFDPAKKEKALKMFNESVPYDQEAVQVPEKEVQIEPVGALQPVLAYNNI